MITTNFHFAHVANNSNSNIPRIKNFLAASDLCLDEGVETFVIIEDPSYKILGCAGIANGIIKCVAIDESLRGSNILLSLMSEVTKVAHEMGYSELFIYTKASNEVLFKNCGFNTLVCVKNNLVLMENSKTRLAKYCEQLASLRKEGEVIGGIVMNANPFTLGHQYLIEEAAKRSDWLHVFLVKEDVSLFSFKDRLELVKQGVSHLDNVTIHEGSQYIISRATFPTYFLQDQNIINEYYMELDITVFRTYIAPALGITHRFVGTEPYSELTNAYNKKMQLILTDEQIDIAAPTIEFVEIPRKQTTNMEYISATKVRKLLAEKEFEAIKDYVPATTFSFILDHYKN